MNDERPTIGRPRTTSDDDIIAAAVRAVERVGPVRLTLAHVAREIGLSPATLVQRFGSKHGLLIAIAERAPADTAAAFTAARASGSSATGALLSALVDPWTSIQNPAALANHLAFLQLDLTDPELMQHTVEHARVLRAGIRQLLDEAVQERMIAVEQKDLGLLTEMIMATVSGSLVTWALDGTGTVGEWLEVRLLFLLARFRSVDAG